jgi:S-adenosyl-L-methionine hydrolase (adenosine-forming)
MNEHRSVIALLTDFGIEDTYVGVMKSVIAARCSASIIDLSHAVLPQNVQHAAYFLSTAYRYLPDGAVTVSVVDPGVGTPRRAIAVRWPRGYFVGPDNGWLTHVLRDDGHAGDRTGEVDLPYGWEAVELQQAKFWLSPVSSTFHGRDIFAPVAAALVNGTPLVELGARRLTLVVIETLHATSENGTVHGHVVHVDHFGNLITDISADHLSDRFTVTVGGGTIEGPAESYQSSEPVIALIGSSGRLEIAAPNASAARLIAVGVGEPVTVVTRRTLETGPATG